MDSERLLVIIIILMITRVVDREEGGPISTNFEIGYVNNLIVEMQYSELANSRWYKDIVRYFLKGDIGIGHLDRS